MKELKTSSRIALQFALFTATSTLIILLCINISFFLIWHSNDRDHVAGIALQQNRIQAVQMALKDTNKRFLMPAQVQEGNNFPPGPRGEERIGTIAVQSQSIDEQDVVNYTRKLIDIIHANDNRWYMVYNDSNGKMILLDITENVERQMDLAWLSVIILIVMITLSYWISLWLVKRSLKDLYRLVGGVQEATLENLHKSLAMDHLPEDDEINIVANAIDDMKKKIHTQVQSIKDFVSHVSHEFKTPLMVMRSDIDLAGKTKDYNELIEKNTQTVQQMQTLLDGLLVLTTAQTGSLDRVEVNMSTLMERVCENMKKKYSDKDIVVHKHIAQHVFVTTHQAGAESMVSNILDNAYKYTQEGGEITVTLDEKHCIIADNGAGIPAEHKEKVWQPFWQADKTRQDGVGLGMAIVQKLSEALQWKVKIEDNNPTGTKITFTFPAI